MRAAGAQLAEEPSILLPEPFLNEGEQDPVLVVTVVKEGAHVALRAEDGSAYTYGRHHLGRRQGGRCPVSGLQETFLPGSVTQPLFNNRWR
jgi:hypothetical protein